MEKGTVVAPKVVSFVVVSAVLREKTKGGVVLPLEFEVPVPHQQGAPEGAIVSAAFQIFVRMGGMMFDKEGGLDFYPFEAFNAPFKLRIKNVIGVGSAGIPAGAPILLK